MIERLSHRYIAKTHTLTLYLAQFLHTFDVRLTYTICLLFFLFLVFFRFSCFRHCCCFHSLFQCSCFNAYDGITLTVNFDYLILLFWFSCQLHFSFTLWMFTLHDFNCCGKKLFSFFCKIPFQSYLTKSHSPTVRPYQIVSLLIQYDRKQLQFIRIIHSKMNSCLISYSNYLNSY